MRVKEDGFNFRPATSDLELLPHALFIFRMFSSTQ